MSLTKKIVDFHDFFLALLFLQALLFILLHLPGHPVHRQLTEATAWHLAAHQVFHPAEVPVGDLAHHLAHLIKLLDHPVDFNDWPPGPGR